LEEDIDMDEKEKPAETMGVMLFVCHPDSNTSDPEHVREYDRLHADDEGHHFYWLTHPQSPSFCVAAQAEIGADPRYVASVLRKIAGILEANPALLNQIGNKNGEIRNGRAMRRPADGGEFEPI
jgi:hypothetical protein